MAEVVSGAAETQGSEEVPPEEVLAELVEEIQLAHAAAQTSSAKLQLLSEAFSQSASIHLRTSGVLQQYCQQLEHIAGAAAPDRLQVCVSVCVSVSVPVSVSVSVSVSVFVCVCLYLCICVSVCLCVCICLCVYLCVYL